MKKSTFALAWEKWKGTEGAKQACDYETLTEGAYLENRISRAFQAGYKAALATVRAEEQS